MHNFIMLIINSFLLHGLKVPSMHDYLCHLGIGRHKSLADLKHKLRVVLARIPRGEGGQLLEQIQNFVDLLFEG